MFRTLAPSLALSFSLALGCAAAPAPPAAQPGEAAPPVPNAGTTPPDGAPAATPAGAATAATKTAGAPAAGNAATDAPILSKITQEDILALVQKNADAFYRCYTVGAGGAKKGYKAKVTVKATVSPVGAVSAVEVLSSTTRSAKVDACVGDAFKKLTFNRPKGSGATVFTFPLSFDGMEQVP